jgi:hypothetical protein
MQEPKEPWTLERLGNLDDAQFQILGFATYGGLPAAVLDRREMERVSLDYDDELRGRPRYADHKVSRLR